MTEIKRILLLLIVLALMAAVASSFKITGKIGDSKVDLDVSMLEEVRTMTNSVSWGSQNSVGDPSERSLKRTKRYLTAQLSEGSTGYESLKV